jgi:hypothetical protein
MRKKWIVPGVKWAGGLPKIPIKLIDATRLSYTEVT